MTDERRVTLRSIRDSEGTRYLSASLNANGDLVIDGQDLGPGVEAFFGPGIREYEWARTVRRPHVPTLLAALGGPPGEDILVVLARRFSGDAAAGLDQAIAAAGVPVEHWSRTGD